MYTRRRNGFTLIELLVVIAIIGILAAMLFPVFARSGESARKIQCLSNVKNIALAMQMYLADYDKTPPHEHRPEGLGVGAEQDEQWLHVREQGRPHEPVPRVARDPGRVHQESGRMAMPGHDDR